MASAGFPITREIEVILDEKLPFMGYTTEREGKSVIVVSGKTFESGSTINLLVHEMSHIYRIQSGHPSHNYQLLTTISLWVMHGKLVEEYQEKIVHALINHLQDIYADDISFAVFSQIPKQSNLSEFFLNWIHKPLDGSDSEEKSWTNASYVVSAAFAQANLERHKVKDEKKVVAHAVADFLSHVDKTSAAKYLFFKNFMVKLPESVTDKEFEKFLIAYLSEFLTLTTIA
jgi:hypothetical protein